MKTDHQFRKYAQLWQRLAVRGDPEGRRRTTSRWFRKFIKHELYASVMRHLECLWKQFHQGAII
jgi:hypothetical protein